ncbi:helix-turn-helix transcriptional regulator [Pedobacter gandavensis]|uniref:Helix-turn-helix domain-containing protein n=1 Tax=Pedobacter gandavensis TaxID=2679963 RepID=A0ABR6EUU1_9SPHI|nr:AraC family transcriptional regulator [Pedobacter gandavensis]MBB2149043.1 helix-turn-helix domain-containing protein [Pedobacter gandavensis]
MNLERIEFCYHYTLGPEWQQQIVDAIGATLTDNKILTMPENIAHGGSIFLEVTPGLSVLLLDMTFKVPVAITRIPTDHQYYMVYFDIGDEITTHIIGNAVHRAGYHAKLGMGFMDCNTKGIIMPPVEQRSYSLRLFIQKDYLKELAASTRDLETNNLLFDESKNTLFFYSHIDSRSKILLSQLKEIDFNAASFDLKLKSTALYLLGYLVERASRFEPIINKLSDHDIEQIFKTSEYLLANLLEEFPGLQKMAEMAEMSVSKYKGLFKKILKDSPNQFFLNEKLLLAQQLLHSGNFSSVQEIAYELGYTSPNYFAKVYKNMFDVLPGEVLKNQPQ